MNPFVGDAVYFNVQQVRSGELMATLRFDTHSGAVSLSPRHLQAPEAPQVLSWMRDVFKAGATNKRFQARLSRVLHAYVFALVALQGVDPQQFEKSLALLMTQAPTRFFAQATLEAFQQFGQAMAIQDALGQQVET